MSDRRTAAVLAVLVTASGFGALLLATPPARAATYWQEDFDPPAPGWGTTGIWHLAETGADWCFGNTTYNHPPAPYNGTGAYAFHADGVAPPYDCSYHLGGGFPFPHSGTATSPLIDLSTALGPVWLHFATWRETDNSPSTDTMKVYLSTGGPAFLVFQLLDPVGNQTAWETIDVDITAAAGSSTVSLYFEFDTVDSQNNDFAGWYIDALLIDNSVPPTNTLTATMTDAAPLNVTQGQVDVPMARIDASVDADNVTLASVNVTLTGLPVVDSNIDAVDLWLDDGDSAFDAAGDLLLDSATFSGNSANMSPAWKVSSALDATFFITFDIAATAGIGDFVGVEVAAATSFTAYPPDGVSCVGCPLDTYQPGVKTRILGDWDNATFTPNDLAPLTANQGQLAVLMGSINVTVDNNTANISSVIANLTGTGTDSDITLVRVFQDDGDGTFDGGDAQRGSGTFASGTSLIALSPPVTVVAGTNETVWITYDISGSTTGGTEVGLQIGGNASLVVGPPDTVRCTGCPMDTWGDSGGTKTVIGNIVGASPADIAPENTLPGAVDVPMLQIDLTVQPVTATLETIRVNRTGNATDADVAAVELRQDDGDSVPSAGDSLLDAGNFASGVVTLAANLSLLAGAPVRLFVSYNISAGATPGGYLGAMIDEDADFVATAPESASCLTCPVDSYVPGNRTRILPEPPNNLTVSPVDQAPAAATAGDLAVLLMRLDLAVDSGSSVVTSIRVNLTGTVANTDITAAQLWSDTGNGVFDGADTLLQTRTFPVTRDATFTVSIPVTAGNPRIEFVSYNVAAAAPAGGLFGGYLDDTSVAATPSVVTCVGCPLDTYDGVKTEILAPPNVSPEATGITVDGAPAGSPGIDHMTSVNPLFAWTFSDPDGGTQSDYEVNVSSTAGASGDIWSSGQVAGGAGSVPYGPGPALVDSTVYYFAVRVRDGTDWSGFNETPFRMNGLPPVPATPTTPGNGAVIPASGSQSLTWTSSGVDPEGDAVTYTWEVDDSPLFTVPLVASGSGPGTSSSPFTTLPTTTYYWWARADDGYESTNWSAIWNFTTNTAPLATSLMVDGTATPDHVLIAAPTLAWTFSDVDTGDTQAQYDVRVGSTPGAGDLWDPAPQAGAASSIVYAGSTLLDGRDYYFGVQVFDGLDWSAPAELRFRTNMLPPPPTAPTTPANGDNTVSASTTQNVSWTAGGTDNETDTLTYEWEVDDSSTFTAPLVDSGSITGTTSTPFTTNPSTTYFWRVRVTDGFETSTYGNPPTGYWTFTTTAVANSRPEARNLTVDGSADASLEISHILTANPVFAWDYLDAENNPQANYQVRISSTPGQSGDVWVTAGTTGLTVTGPVLADGATYYFAVRVGDAGGMGPFEEIPFRLNTPPPAPVLQSPPNAAAIDSSPTQTVTWTFAGDTEGDTVTFFWQVATDAAYANIVASDNTTLWTSAPFVTNPGTPYFWRVRANDSWEDGAPAARTFTTRALNAVPVASFLGVDGHLDGTPDILHILTGMPVFNWTYTDADSNPQAGYQIYVGTTSGASDVWDSGQVGGNTTSATYAGAPALADGTTYFFSVRVNDSATWSTGVAVAFRLNTPPGPPALTSPANNSSPSATGLTLTWSAPTDAEGDSPLTYTVEVSTAITFASPASNTGPALTWSFTTALPGTTYYWRVRANDGWETGTNSVVFTFTTQAPTSVTWNITVTVTDANGAVSGATVRLLLSGTDFRPTQVTGPGGQVAFADVPSGTYTLSVTKTGYGDATRSVILTTTSGDQVVPVPLSATPGGEQPTEGFPLWVLLLLIVVIVAVILLLLLRKKRKPAVEATPPEGKETAEVLPDGTEGEALAGEEELPMPADEEPTPDFQETNGAEEEADGSGEEPEGT